MTAFPNPLTFCLVNVLLLFFFYFSGLALVYMAAGSNRHKNRESKLTFQSSLKCCARSPQIPSRVRDLLTLNNTHNSSLSCFRYRDVRAREHFVRHVVHQARLSCKCHSIKEAAESNLEGIPRLRELPFLPPPYDVVYVLRRAHLFMGVQSSRLPSASFA